MGNGCVFGGNPLSVLWIVSRGDSCVIHLVKGCRREHTLMIFTGRNRPHIIARTHLGNVVRKCSTCSVNSGVQSRSVKLAKVFLSTFVKTALKVHWEKLKDDLNHSELAI